MYNRPILVILFLLFAVWLTGIAGYMLIEGWNLLDSTYMTTISLTTVGYGETRPLTDDGKIFTMFLITMGMGLFIYALGLITEVLFSGSIKGLFEKKKMDKKIRNLSNHYIVCGYGKIGKIVSRELAKANIPLVVLEKNLELLNDLKESRIPFILDDATTDEVLLKAGLMSAKGIITLLQGKEANIYIVLTARYLNKKIKIITRADTPTSQNKMIQAGADEVIAPYEIGGMKLALSVLKPTVIEFLDIAGLFSEIDLIIEQINIKSNTIFENSTLKGLSLRVKTGVTVLAVKRSSGEMFYNITPDFLLKSKDTMVVIGSNHSVEKVKEMAETII